MTACPLTSDPDLNGLLAAIRACRICREQPLSGTLPHDPRPVLQVSGTARLLLAGQAPGIRVHLSGAPFTDPSGDRLRDWLGLDKTAFYDPARLAIIPMGFCFPGHDAKKGDLPPRRECREAWHGQLMQALPQVETVLAIGRYAQAWHFARLGRALNPATAIGDIVRASVADDGIRPRLIALPHPSWRNSGWLNANPWFAQEVLPLVRAEVARLTGA